MKEYKHINLRVFIFIDETNQKAWVSGSKIDSKWFFKNIHRKAPNEFGNFYGREHAGFLACKEILKKFNDEFESLNSKEYDFNE